MIVFNSQDQVYEWADVEEEPYEGGWCANPRNDDDSGFPNQCPDPEEVED